MLPNDFQSTGTMSKVKLKKVNDAFKELKKDLASMETNMMDFVKLDKSRFGWINSYGLGRG